MIRRAAPIAAALALAGCAAPVPPQVITRTVYVRQHVPASLLTCDPSPVVPGPTSQAVVAHYLVRLWLAGQDCRAKLAGVRAALDPAP